MPKSANEIHEEFTERRRKHHAFYARVETILNYVVWLIWIGCLVYLYFNHSGHEPLLIGGAMLATPVVISIPYSFWCMRAEKRITRLEARTYWENWGPLN
jgi:hypothetical protein